jgi:glutathione S-transferase
MPTIHGVSLSPFVRKARVVLEEKGIDYELVPVMPFGQTDEFRAISPLGKVPVYQDGDFTLPDSSCIALYIERLHPKPPLYPDDAQAYGRALFFEEYGDTKLVDVLTPVFFQRLVTARLMKGEADEELVQECLCERIPPVFDWLETQVGDGEGIVDGRFTIADIAIASPIVNLEHGGEAVDSSRWPKLADYAKRILARPSFKKLIEEEKSGYAAM